MKRYGQNNNAITSPVYLISIKSWKKLLEQREIGPSLSMRKKQGKAISETKDELRSDPL